MPSFPIQQREKGRGLEISFGTMAHLAAYNNLVEEYGGDLILAGLVSVLLPIVMLAEDDCVIQGTSLTALTRLVVKRFLVLIVQLKR
jgi:hypothetical protein